MPNGDELDEVGKKGGGLAKKWMWGIIGGVVIVAIIVGVVAKGGGPAEGETVPSGLTLESVNTNVQALVTWKATTTETLANLQSQVNGVTVPKNWSPEINAIKADIDALGISVASTVASVEEMIEEAVSGLNFTAMPRYAMVSNMAEKLTGIYIDVSVYGKGSYPVLITLYGENLEDAEVSVKGSECDIAVAYLYGDYELESVVAPVFIVSHNLTLDMTNYNLTFTGTKLVNVVMSGEAWDGLDLIEMKVTGEDVVVCFAAAAVGESWAEMEEEW